MLKKVAIKKKNKISEKFFFAKPDFLDFISILNRNYSYDEFWIK